MKVRLLSLESFYDNSLALDYLSAYANTRPALSASGVEFRTLICRADASRKSFWEEFYNNAGDVVGFNTYVWNIEATVKASREIKRRHPDTTVVLGGMEAAYTAQSL